MNITIVGGGNLGTLLGAVFANRGHKVTLRTSKPESFSNEIEVYNRDENLILKGTFDRITNNWRDAIEGAEIVFIVIPPHLFSEIANSIEPFVTKGQLVGIIPGAGGAEFAFKPIIEKGCHFFGFARVPSIARIKEPGKSVYMLGPAPELLIGSIPAKNACDICKNIQPLFMINCRPVDNYLAVTFTPSNPILHTARLYGMFKDYISGNHYPTNELFYENWTIDGAEILLKCSDELQQLCKAVPMDMRDVESMQARHNIRTPEELAEKISKLERLKGLRSPVLKDNIGYFPDFDSRFFASDFTFGIKIIIDVARLFDVPTPTMDTIWEWYKSIQPEKSKDAFELKMTKEEFISYYLG